MTYTAEEQQANREKWVAALRSGEFKQAQEVLKVEDPDTEPRYCCLGVACSLAIREGIEEDWPDAEFADWDQELPDSIRDWLGLQNNSGTLTEVIEGGEHLIWLNDNANYTFDQIADVIEGGKVKLQGRKS